MNTIHLGLIGDNIAASGAPDLHRAAAKLCGINIDYQKLVPSDLGLDFEAVVEQSRSRGFRGLNITYPYKERILEFVTIESAVIKAIAACNTVLFGNPTIGLNTDHTGFLDAFRYRFGDVNPGAVAMAGSGGVGKAIAYALARLGARSICVFDMDERKSSALAQSLSEFLTETSEFRSTTQVQVASTLQDACEDATGLINCTPLGMVGYGGNAFEGIKLNGVSWIFDAVYTPLKTAFVKQGHAAGVEVLSGYELFLFQGIHAFRLFTGHQVDAGALRGAFKLRDSPQH
jgi:shikimate dehydrogenase